MSTRGKVQIKPNENFRHLAQAPIVEAVIDIRAPAGVELEESSLRSELEGRLAGYHFVSSRRAFEGRVQFQEGEGPSQTLRHIGWQGLRFKSDEEKDVVEFNRSGFLFSRLQPYKDWRQLSSEALKLWEVFRAVANPEQIDRLGVRFINRISLPPGQRQWEAFLQDPPQPPTGFEVPVDQFTHQDALAVPGHPYRVNLLRTIQEPNDPSRENGSLILDIDVFTTHEMELDDARLKAHLEEMRWLKNKTFFGTLSETALESFQ